MSFILAVDPGGTVGYALYPLEGGGFRTDRVQAGQASVEDFLDWAYESIGEGWLVVCERFTITANTAKLTAGGAHDTLDVIGVLRHLCRWRGAKFRLQTPGQAKNFVTDSQLKTLGLWVKSQDHARDAIRHLVFGIVNSTRGETCDDLKQRMAG
jgi:hypothetical protein